MPATWFRRRRVGLLAALANALAMLAVVSGIGVEAWSRFQSSHAIEGALVGAVATVGLGVNLLVAWMLSHGRQNINVRGAFLCAGRLRAVSCVREGGVTK